MSALDIAALVIAWGALLIIVGRERIRDVLNDLAARPDRRRHIADCSSRERSCPHCGDEIPCFCLALQLDEIRALPVVDPARRRRLV